MRSVHQDICRMLVWVAAPALSVLVSPARAEDSRFRVAQHELAARVGLGNQAHPLLSVVPQADGTRVARLLAQRLGRGSSRATTRAGELSVMADDGRWSVRVTADGAYGRFEQRHDLARSTARAMRSPGRPSFSWLEALGRRQLATALDGIVRLDGQEDIVPFKAIHETVGLQAATARTPSEVVVASTIVFTRTVEGVPVLGAGSKVAMTFSSDGALRALAFDWPRYVRSTSHQQPVSLARILQRMDTSLSRMRRISSARPLQASDLRTLECGYFDRGARRRFPQVNIQLACVGALPQSTSSAGAGKPSLPAHVAVVPAGATIERDGSWKETALLSASPGALGQGLPSDSVLPSVGHSAGGQRGGGAGASLLP